MEAARVMLVQREQPPARQPSDIGSTPATFQSNAPAGIGSLGRAGRETHELARARLVEIRPGIGRRYTWTLQLPAHSASEGRSMRRKAN